MLLHTALCSFSMPIIGGTILAIYLLCLLQLSCPYIILGSLNLLVVNLLSTLLIISWVVIFPNFCGGIP